MDLHYTHADSKLRQTESQQLDIGKPLVASCKLYSGRNHAATDKQCKGATAQSMGNISSSKALPNQTLVGPCRPFTRKAECKNAAMRSNEPEENDENELQDFSPQR